MATELEVATFMPQGSEMCAILQMGGIHFVRNC
jgi:hypothetical protein